MALPQHYLAALITPSGRINQFGFAALAMALAFANVWLFGFIKNNPQPEIWNIYSITLFAMVWMKFCIMSRRMHDTGKSGIILIPVLFISLFAFIAVIDPRLLGENFGSDAGSRMILEHGTKITRSLFIAVFLYLVRAGGEDGDNAYGPEFGDGPAFRMPFSGGGEKTSTIDKIERSQVASHSYRRLAPDGPGPQWGERRRTGFGRR